MPKKTLGQGVKRITTFHINIYLRIVNYLLSMTTTDLTAYTPIRCPHYHSLLSMIKPLLQTVQYNSVLISHTEIQPIFTSSAQSMTSTVAENNTLVVQQTRWKRKYTFQTERI